MARILHRPLLSTLGGLLLAGCAGTLPVTPAGNGCLNLGGQTLCPSGAPSAPASAGTSAPPITAAATPIALSSVDPAQVQKLEPLWTYNLKGATGVVVNPRTGAIYVEAPKGTFQVPDAVGGTCAGIVTLDPSGHKVAEALMPGHVSYGPTYYRQDPGSRTYGVQLFSSGIPLSGVTVEPPSSDPTPTPSSDASPVASSEPIPAPSTSPDAPAPPHNGLPAERADDGLHHPLISADGRHVYSMGVGYLFDLDTTTNSVRKVEFFPAGHFSLGSCALSADGTKLYLDGSVVLLKGGILDLGTGHYSPPPASWGGDPLGFVSLGGGKYMVGSVDGYKIWDEASDAITSPVLKGQDVFLGNDGAAIGVSQPLGSYDLAQIDLGANPPAVHPLLRLPWTVMPGTGSLHAAVRPGGQQVVMSVDPDLGSTGEFTRTDGLGNTVVVDTRRGLVATMNETYVQSLALSPDGATVYVCTKFGDVSAYALP